MTAKTKMYGLEELTAMVGQQNMIITKSCIYQLSLIFPIISMLSCGGVNTGLDQYCNLRLGSMLSKAQYMC